MRGGRLRREDRDLIFRRSGPERVDGSLRAGGRDNEQVARLVESEIDGIERIVALNRQPLSSRPSVDALLVVIDEVEFTGGIDRSAGDGEEAVFQFFDLGAGRKVGRGIVGSEDGRVFRNVEHGEFTLADFKIASDVLNRILVREFADAERTPRLTRCICSSPIAQNGGTCAPLARAAFGADLAGRQGSREPALGRLPRASGDAERAGDVTAAARGDQHGGRPGPEMNDEYVSTEHLLVGLAADGGQTATLLRDAGLTPDALLASGRCVLAPDSRPRRRLA